MKPLYVVSLWRKGGARWGKADSTTTYNYNTQDRAQRQAAAWMAYEAETVATVVEVEG